MKPKSLHEQHKSLFVPENNYRPKTISLKKKKIQEKLAKQEVARVLKGEEVDDGSENF